MLQSATESFSQLRPRGTVDLYVSAAPSPRRGWLLISCPLRAGTDQMEPVSLVAAPASPSRRRVRAEFAPSQSRVRPESASSPPPSRPPRQTASAAGAASGKVKAPAAAPWWSGGDCGGDCVVETATREAGRWSLQPTGRTATKHDWIIHKRRSSRCRKSISTDVSASASSSVGCSSGGGGEERGRPGRDRRHGAEIPRAARRDR